MKIGEVWEHTFSSAPHYVKIDNMDVLKDYPRGLSEEEWIGYEYCSKDGDLGKPDNRSGDSMLRTEFLRKYKKVR